MEKQKRDADARVGKDWTVIAVTNTSEGGIWGGVEHRVVLQSAGERWEMRPCNSTQYTLLQGDRVRFEIKLSPDKASYTVCDLQARLIP